MDSGNRKKLIGNVNVQPQLQNTIFDYVTLTLIADVSYCYGGAILGHSQNQRRRSKTTHHKTDTRLSCHVRGMLLPPIL